MLTAKNKIVIDNYIKRRKKLYSIFYF